MNDTVISAHALASPSSVCAPEDLDGLTLDGQPFERLVVMSFDDTDALRAEIRTLPVPLDRVFWL